MNKWDSYFLRLCKEVASNSSCMSRQIGALIVRDKSIISTGYNGPPRKTRHCNERFWSDALLLKEIKHQGIIMGDDLHLCPRKVLGYKTGEGLQFCVAAHAEVNVIANAARLGVSIYDSILYLNTDIPCKNCACIIINAGIKEVVVSRMVAYDLYGNDLLIQAGVFVRSFS